MSSTETNMQNVRYDSPISKVVAGMSKQELVDFVTYCWASKQTPSISVARSFHRGYPNLEHSRNEGGNLML